jgi:hypothetical protein
MNGGLKPALQSPQDAHSSTDRLLIAHASRMSAQLRQESGKPFLEN